MSHPSSPQDGLAGAPRAASRIKIIAALALAATTAIVLFALSSGGLLPEAQDRALYDIRSYYLTRPVDKQRDDIALVLINEDSLTGYHCLSPVDRGLIAELVRAVDGAGAKAIGLDFIIDRPAEPEKHKALVDAIKGAKNAAVVQATLSSGGPRPHEFAYQEAYLTESGAQAGHLYFGSERNRFTLGDQAVRYRMPEGFGDPSRPSFAMAIAKAAKIEAKTPTSNLITWQRAPLGATDLFATLVVRPHRDPSGNRLRDPLSPRSLEALAGKIVLIGGAFSDRDRHLTPWTIASGDRVPGVEVHAQILAHLKDGRWTYEARWWWEIPLLFILVCAGFYAAQRWRISGSGLITTVAAFAVLILAGIVLYAALRVMLPSATIILAWSAGLFFGSIADRALSWLQRVR